MVKIFKGIFFFLVSIQLVGCINFTYNSYGSVRKKYVPKEFLKYKTAETTIDTNCIYVSKNDNIYVSKEYKFFYKFYGHNKVCILQYKGSNVTAKDVNPLNGKMGYFYQEKNKITTFILIKTEMAKFDKSYLRIDSMGNLIAVYYDTKAIYQKQRLPESTPYINPDW